MRKQYTFACADCGLLVEPGTRRGALPKRCPSCTAARIRKQAAARPKAAKAVKPARLCAQCAAVLAPNSRASFCSDCSAAHRRERQRVYAKQPHRKEADRKRSRTPERRAYMAAFYAKHRAAGRERQMARAEARANRIAADARRKAARAEKRDVAEWLKLFEACARRDEYTPEEIEKRRIARKRRARASAKERLSAAYVRGVLRKRQWVGPFQAVPQGLIEAMRPLLMVRRELQKGCE